MFFPCKLKIKKWPQTGSKCIFLSDVEFLFNSSVTQKTSKTIRLEILKCICFWKLSMCNSSCTLLLRRHKKFVRKSQFTETLLKYNIATAIEVILCSCTRKELLPFLREMFQFHCVWCISFNKGCSPCSWWIGPRFGFITWKKS